MNIFALLIIALVSFASSSSGNPTKDTIIEGVFRCYDSNQEEAIIPMINSMVRYCYRYHRTLPNIDVNSVIRLSCNEEKGDKITYIVQFKCDGPERGKIDGI